MIKKKAWGSIFLKMEEEIFRERAEVQKRFLGKDEKKEDISACKSLMIRNSSGTDSWRKHVPELSETSPLKMEGERLAGNSWQ